MRVALGALVLLVAGGVGVEAQHPIFWTKDYIRDAGGSMIAVAAPTPSIASITPGATSVQLAWTAPEQTEGGAELSGYRIFRGASVAGTVRTGTRFIDIDLQPDTQYTYTIAALDLAGNPSALSAPATVKTLPANP